MSGEAVLGARVETNAKEASRDLSAFAATAEVAERSVAKLGKTSETAAQRVSSGSKMYDRALASMEKMLVIMERMEAEQRAIAASSAATAAGIERLTGAVEKLHRVGSGGGPRGPLAPLNDNLPKLGENARLASHQLLNLSRQGNDVLTMLALGASPMQVFASQIGQVYDAIASGEGGLKGGLTAVKNTIGDVLKSIGPLGYAAAAVGALSAGVVGYAYAVQKSVPDMDEVFKKHDAVLKQIEERYGRISNRVKDIGNWRGSIVSITAGKELSDLRKVLDDQAKEFDAKVRGISGMFGRNSGLLAGTADPTGGYALGFGEADTNAVQKKLQPIAKEIDALRDGLKSGNGDVLKFMDTMDRMYAQAGDDKELKKAIETATEFGTTLFEVTTRTNQLKQALWEAQSGIKRFRTDMGQFKDATAGMASYLPDTRSDRARIEDDFRVAMSKAKTEADERRAIELHTASLTELERVEKNRRAGYDLDIRGLTARTAQEKAALAAERARIDAAADPKLRNDQDKVNKLAQEASDRSMAESRAQLAEATRQQSIATADQVAQMQEELQLFGKSAGETARLRAEFEMLAQAKEAARAAGFDDKAVALTQEMRDQAKAIGEVTDALEKMQFQKDVAFRLAQAGRSDQDRRIAQELYSQGIDFNSEEGQSRAGVLRYVETVEKAGDAMRDFREAGKDAWEDVAAAIGRGENALESFVSAFAPLGQKLFSQGFDKLFGGILNGPQSASVQATKIATVQASLGSSGPSYSGGIGSDYARSVSPIRSVSTSAALSSSPAVTIWRFFESKGLSKVAIAGIMGNGFAESGYNPRAVGDNGNALGVFQWNDRSKALKDFANGDWQDLGKQLDFAWKELNTTERGTLERLKQATTVSGATQAFLGFERPQGYSASDPTRSHNYSGRLSAAEAAYSKYGDGVTSKVVSDGVIDANRKMATGAVPIPTQRPTTSEGGVGINPAQIDKFSGGMQALGAGLGIFSQGFQSQSPLMGGITGAISGVGASASLAAAFGLAAGPLAPVGAAVGAIVGAVGGVKGKRQAPKGEQAAMSAAWDNQMDRRAA